MTMEPSLLSIQILVSEIKKEIFSDEINFHAFISPSAYDTAWLAIPHCKSENGPMFESCLNWVLENQSEGGFWGEINRDDGLPSIDTLPATLACLLALKKWNVGHQNVDKGLAFIHSNVERILGISYEDLPRWFILVFPAMIELCEAAGLDLVFPDGIKRFVTDIFIKRRQILDMEKLVDESSYFPPLLSYLETLPPTYHYDRQVIVKHVNKDDGSLFQSPSATACAFLATENVKCINYLRSLVQKFPNGVPAKYPMDEEVIKLCMVDHIQRLGLAEHFTQEIDQILGRVYRNQKDYKSNPKETEVVSIKLFKDALAFRLLRMEGHYVNPESFCWFLHDVETLTYIEENCEQFISAMYSVYRATDLLFPGESAFEQARKFARKMLQNSNTTIRDHNFVISKGLQNVINHELNVPWIAQLDRLYHRKWIEENNSPLWIGKASFYRLRCLDNEKLMQLAIINYEFRQSLYQHELEELKRWSKKWTLSEMGFGREKTTYTYFAVAASTCFPFDSNMRLAIAKAAIIITISDDFYDMEGSSRELEDLTDAIRRWDGEGLKGHGKTIFDALDDLVNYIAKEYHPLEENRTVTQLQHIWRETFFSWMVEKTWSMTGYVPSMDEYLETGMVSIAAHTVTLPATSFLRQSSQNGTLKPFEYHNITKLLMIIARLLNDTQSYQKEQADGKMNLVMLYLNQNQNICIEDSIAYVKEILEVKRKEFLEHVFTDGFHNDMPKSCKEIHLSCMKVFQMFFNFGNLFDTDTALVDDIKETIYLPIRHRPKSKSLNPSPSVPPNKQKKVLNKSFNSISKIQGSTSLSKQRSIKNTSAFPRGGKLHIPMTFNMCFI